MVAGRARAGLRGRGARHRERAVGAGSARAAAREAAGGRPGASSLPRRALRLPVAARAVAVLRAEARPKTCRTAGWSTPVAPGSSRTSGCANGATCMRSSRARWPSRAWTVAAGSCPPRSTPRGTRPSTRRCSRACSATSACRTARATGIWARGASGSTCIPGRGSRRSGPNGCWRPSSSRPRGSTRAARRRSSPSGSRRSRATA